MKLGSHVSMSGPKYIFGSVQEALDYNASALMLYTGAPQNSKRVPIEQLKVDEALELWKQAGYDNEAIIVHAPYIINLANTLKPDTYEMGKEILLNEVKRTKAIGAKYLVVHPGATVGGDLKASLAQVAEGLNEILQQESDVCICLETMAGKGSEVGRTFEELKEIIDQVHYPIGVCLDSCHVHDGGYDLTNLDHVIDQFDHVIGLDKLHVIHVNDSKNVLGAHKDRHANIGQGEIGFEVLRNIVHHPRLQHCVFILETPYVDGNPIYKEEIEMLR